MVNATPIGMQGEPLPEEVVSAGSGLFDMAYGSGPTPAVRLARQLGLPVAEGPDMLLAQAAASFTIWTGIDPPLEEMRAALVRRNRRGPGMTILVVVAALAGIGAGWLATAVAHRVPLDQELGPPWVRCPHCEAAATGLDRFPLISYLRLGGKCRSCGAAIGLRYPVVEVVTGALFAGAALLIGFQWILPAYLWFIAVTMTLVLTDLDHQRIPNRILYPGAAIGVVLLTAGAAGDGLIGAHPRGAARRRSSTWW